MNEKQKEITADTPAAGTILAHYTTGNNASVSLAGSGVHIKSSKGIGKMKRAFLGSVNDIFTREDGK